MKNGESIGFTCKKNLFTTYEIWKVKKRNFFIANFQVLGLFMPKKLVKSEFFFRLSSGAAGVPGRWSKFL
jgi:hypothetical protein